jgi:hypothetical protein
MSTRITLQRKEPDHDQGYSQESQHLDIVWSSIHYYSVHEEYMPVRYQINRNEQHPQLPLEPPKATRNSFLIITSGC